MSEGKVDHVEVARSLAAQAENLRNKNAGVQSTDVAIAAVAQVSSMHAGAIAHALVALVEEVRGLRESLDGITEDGYTTGKRRVLTAEDVP
jgi:hypothetical protein